MVKGSSPGEMDRPFAGAGIKKTIKQTGLPAVNAVQWVKIFGYSLVLSINRLLTINEQVSPGANSVQWVKILTDTHWW